MTKTYNPVDSWSLVFSDGRQVVLTEQDIYEIIQQFPKILTKHKEAAHGKLFHEQTEKQSSNNGESK